MGLALWDGTLPAVLRLSIVFLAPLSLWGCTPDSEVSGDGVTVRDSAGIAIVESTSPRWGPTEGWSVNPEPILDLATSGTGASHEFFRVRDAIRLPDRTIAVADAGSHEISLFSATGEFLQAAGREGEGPGEFRGLSGVDRFRGDSLVAFDFWLGRLTVLTPRWEVARVISVGGSDLQADGLHSLDDTTLVARLYSIGFMAGTEGPYRMPSLVARLFLTGEMIDTVMVVPGYEGFAFSGGDARQLFAKRAHLAVHQKHIYLGSADLMQFEVYAATGQLERIVRVPNFDLSLSAQELREERAAFAEGFPPDAPGWVFDMVAALPDRETRPAYDELLVDTEGFVWAAEFHARTEATEPTDWEVFNPEGEWLGSVRVPARFTVFEIGSDYVLGKRLDDLDVEHVELLQLTR